MSPRTKPFNRKERALRVLCRGVHGPERQKMMVRFLQEPDVMWALFTQEQYGIQRHRSTK